MTTDIELETTLPATDDEDRDYEFSTDESESSAPAPGEGEAAGASSEEAAGSEPPPAPVEAEALNNSSSGISLGQLPVSVNLQFAVDDGNPAGRSLILGIRLGQGVPVIYALREEDLGGPLPQLVTSKIEELAASASVNSLIPATPGQATSVRPVAQVKAPVKAGAGSSSNSQQLELLSLFDE
jgi:hypothetical protein